MDNSLITAHLDFLLSNAIAKCQSLADAQDLTQETILSALAYIKKGGEIKNVRAWLLSVMTRRYYDMLRRKYQLPTVAIGEGFDIPDCNDFDDPLIKQEEAAEVRREVAYLADSYRSVIVKRYFENKGVGEISRELGLPEGTVKSRLDFGRKQIKKGFDCMENYDNYSQNSYMPQQLRVSNSGRFGLNGEPMSLVEEDILAQNLLILAYDKPITVSELSRKIGVAAAYTEPVIKKLVDGELMKRLRDGRVYTDFIIYDADDYVKYIHEEEAFAHDNIEAYLVPAKAAIEKLKQKPYYSHCLERMMLIHIAENGLYDSMKPLRHEQIFPERPNGGRWIAFGTKYPNGGWNIPKDMRGKHEYGYAGLRNLYIDSFIGSKGLKIYNYETSLDPNSWQKHSGFGYNSFMDIELDMLRLFYLIHKDIAPETVDLDTKMIKGIPLLEERGFISHENGKLKLDIPVLTHEQEKEFFGICGEASEAFANSIRKPLSEYCRTHIKEIPPHLKSVPDQKRTMPYEPNAMMFVYEAIEKGLHQYEKGVPCPETFIVID